MGAFYTAQAEAQVDSARAELEKARQALGVEGEANPRIRAAIADLKKAQLDLSRTTILAPSKGGITNLQVEEGYYASVFYAYFASLGMEITPEDTSSQGQLDMAVKFNNQVYLFEFKLVEDEAEGKALDAETRAQDAQREANSALEEAEDAMVEPMRTTLRPTRSVKKPTAGDASSSANIRSKVYLISSAVMGVPSANMMPLGAGSTTA